MKQYFQGLIHLIFPKVCYGCGNSLFVGEKVICTKCEANLPRTRYSGDENNPVAQIFWGRVPIEHACSYLFYRKKSITQHLIHQFKYNNEKEIGLYLGHLFAEELKALALFSDIDFIVPVPLHHYKEKKRGYNQSFILCKALAEVLNISIDSKSLKRITNTSTQTKKSKFQRWENVSTVFVLSKNHILLKKRVLLVDDVITTGSTLESCANVLINQAQAKVSIATLAIAD